MPAFSTCAVYICYKCGDLILESLFSLLRGSTCPSHILVIDNRCPDQSWRVIEAASLDNVSILHADENRGFAAGCNLGIDFALKKLGRPVDALWFINPDTVADTDCLAYMQQLMAANANAGCVGTRQYTDDGRWYYDGGVLVGGRLGHHRDPDADAPSQNDWVTGSSMMIRSKPLQDGLRFDERYFLYAEDADLCFRLKAQGWELWHDTRATLIHDYSKVIGTASPVKSYYLARSRFLFPAYVERRELLGPLEDELFARIDSSRSLRAADKRLLHAVRKKPEQADLSLHGRLLARALERDEETEFWFEIVAWWDAMRGISGKVEYFPH
jgi:alpha-1,3-rhamnosyl/mannosyltransferase